MADFKIIETQEELNRILAERLNRAKDKAKEVEENFRKEIATLQDQISTKDAEISKLTETQNSHADEVAKLNSEIATYKLSSIKHQIAHQNGLPYELAERLTGTDEDSLRADAENLKKYIGPKTAPPLATPELPPEDSKNSDFRKLAQTLNERN